MERGEHGAALEKHSHDLFSFALDVSIFRSYSLYMTKQIQSKRAAVEVEMYTRISGYWYADAYLADGRKVACSAGHNQGDAVHELIMASAMLGREVLSIRIVDAPRNYAPPVFVGSGVTS